MQGPDGVYEGPGGYHASFGALPVQIRLNGTTLEIKTHQKLKQIKQIQITGPNPRS